MNTKDREEFFEGYVGLASNEVMNVIYQFDWDSIHEWKNHNYNDSFLCDLIGNLYENFWAGHNTEDMADDIILAAYEALDL